MGERVKFSAGLVTNSVAEADEPSTEMAAFQSLTFNLGGVKTRNEILEGTNYLVVPMVMITEGVHAGSNGPLYYPTTELAKTPVVWNHKPVVVNHPQMNGSAISACEPAVISRRKVGIIMNTRYIPGKRGEPGKLKAEAWLNMNRLKEVDEPTYNRVKNGEMVEVSTGLFTDNEQTEGVWNKSKRYESIARNYRPDHLAILPDEKGACSIADGAGLMRNAEQSFDEIRSRLSELVQPQAPAIPGAPREYVYLQDVFKNFFVFQKNGKTYRQGYCREDGVLKLDGAPAPVTRTVKYVTSDGKTLNTAALTRNTGAPMDRETLINRLITNSNSPFDEGDREKLDSMSDKQLRFMATNAGIKHKDGQDKIDSGGDDQSDSITGRDGKVNPRKMGSKSGAEMNSGDDDGDDVTDKKKPTRTAADKKKDAEDNADDQGAGQGKGAVKNSAGRTQAMTVDEYINNAPEGLRDVLRSGIKAHEGQRSSLIGEITANEANPFSDEYLEGRSLEELQGLAKLSKASTTPATNSRVLRGFNYGGQGDAGGPTNNEVGDTEVEPLVAPTLNFSKKAS